METYYRLKIIRLGGKFQMIQVTENEYNSFVKNWADIHIETFLIRGMKKQIILKRKEISTFHLVDNLESKNETDIHGS